MKRKTVTPDELAEELGISRGKVYENLRAGLIPHVRLGRRFVIPRIAVDRWLADCGPSADNGPAA